jgi:uncharacterized phage-like protein YoqJ
MNVGFTGHRNCRKPEWLHTTLHEAVGRAAEKGARWFVSGGAPGMDCRFLEAAMLERWHHAGRPGGFDEMYYVKGLPDGVVVMAALPFPGFWEHYREQEGSYFDTLYQQLDVVGHVSQGGYDVKKIHARNRWIVDESDVVIAVYDGRQRGGTYSTLRYAKQKRKPILWINPENETDKWIRPGVDYG